jgi:hypothetical protein
MHLQGQGKWCPRDSVRDALQCTPGFRVGLDGRYSFLSGHPVRVAGARIGLDYGKVGIYTGLYSTRFSLVAQADTVYTGFQYFSSTFEYYLYETWRFQIVNSWQLGFGNAYDYQKSGSEVSRSFQGAVMPVEIGLGGTVRFLRYFGFCAGFGIRLSPINGAGFSGTYYSYGLTFFSGTMYRDCKKAYKRITR